MDIKIIENERECAYLNEAKMKELGLTNSLGLKAQIIETFHIYENHKPVSQSKVLICPAKRDVSECVYEKLGTRCIQYKND